jgi:hypothetical protein
LRKGWAGDEMRLGKVEYKKIYAMLDEVTPLEYDCGLLCGRICCQGGDNIGMYLLPGEEEMFTGKEDWLKWERHKVKFYDFPPSWKGTVNFVICNKYCPRKMRPLQCRFYPLAPHLLRDGSLLIIYDPSDSPYECPLITGKMKLSAKFVSTVYEVWHILLGDEKIKALVEWDSRAREETANFIPEILLAEEVGNS